MSTSPTSSVVELIGVYHADGGLVGEGKYIIGKMLGTAHCALCDITHSPVRRKREWNRMVAGLGIPFMLVHLNEMPADVAAVVGQDGSPAVLARLNDGAVITLLTESQLDRLGGSVAAFEQALRVALDGLEEPDRLDAETA